MLLELYQHLWAINKYHFYSTLVNEQDQCSYERISEKKLLCCLAIPLSVRIMSY